MNYVGKFGLGTQHGDFDLSPRGGHFESVTLPDAHLLFSGNYERSGDDLVVSDHLYRVVVPHYFHGEKRPTLFSPEGAPLDSRVVDSLTKQTTYAQAAGVTPTVAKVVGNVVKMTGSASVVRNGVTITLNNGDAVYQTDVIQTGSGSTLGIVLIDGTTFNLTANARLMLNDLTYDPSSTSNTSLYSLVEGAASFVAGQVAKTGDMQVATPSAVVGIRGTAVILNINSADGKVSISVVDQQDGQVHSVQVLRCLPVVPGGQGICTSGDPIGTVASNGATLTITPAGAAQVITQEISKSPAAITQEFSVFQQVLSTYDAGKQLAPNTPPPSDGKRGDVNPQSTTKFAGSSTITPPDQPGTVATPVSDTAQHPNAITETAISGTTPSSSAIVNPIPLPITQQTPAILPVIPTTVAITSPVTVGNIINQSALSTGFIISGTATAGASPASGQTVTVAIVDSMNIVKETFTTTVSNGTWSVNVTAAQAQALADGSYSITAVVKDSVGNTLTAANQTVAVFTVAPTVSVSTHGTATNQPTQTISGTVTTTEAAAGTTVSLYDTVNGAKAQIGAATIDSNGNWTSSVTLSGNGTHSIVAQDIDAVGNVGTSAPVVFTLATGAPTISITSPVAGDNIINKAEAAAGVTISGIATAGGAAVNGQTATITIVDATNVVKDTYSAVVTGGAWSISVTAAQAQALADGSYSIKANVVDAAGNAAPTASQAIAVDETAPTISITSPVAGDNIINKAEAAAGVTISGIATAGGAAVNGQTATITIVDATNVVKDTYSAVVTGGAWSISVTAAQAQALADGSYSIKANVVDAAGNAAPTASQAIAVDTAPPTVSIITAGTTTNQATQPISGTVTTTEAAAGSTVALFDTVNGVTTQIGTAPVSGNTWSTSVTLSGNGINSIVAQDTDLAGNVGTSAPVVFTLATAAPTISITSPVAGDNIINKAEAAAGVTISGIATAGGAAVNGQTATITIVDATNVVKDTYSAVVTGGAWSISVTAAQAQALADGSYSIKANVVDAAGNAAPTASQAIAVDETAPTISITSPVAGDNIINKAEAAAGVTISGIATAGGAAVNGQTATITIVDATNVVKDTYSAVVTGGAWSISVTAAQAQALADGSYSIKANVVDAAGNAAPTASQAIAVDETAPTISITSPVAGDNIINKAEAAAGVTISGIATAGGAAVNGQTATITIVDATNVVKDTYSAVVTGGAWSISVTAAQAQALADGSYSIKANVVDAAGNAAPTASQAIAVDETAPTISITSPVAGDNIINKAEAAAGVTISGIATAGGAAVNGQTATITIVDATNVVKDTYSAVVTGGAWSISVTAAQAQALADGSYSIKANVVDAAGNAAPTASQAIAVDETAPTISITSPVAGDNIINKAEAAAGVTISGIATAGGAAVNGQTATITIVDATNVVKDTYSAVVTGGAWSISVTAAQAQALADGSYSIKANVVDAAGNAAPTASQAIAVDETAPTISITSPVAGDNIINKAEAAAGVTISGIATAGGAAVNGQTATITIVDATNVVKDTYSAVVTGGAWSISVTAAQAQALADGSYSIKANVVDAAGNAAPTASQAIAVDTAPPTVSIITAGTTTNQATQPISGTVTTTEAAAGSTVALFDTVNGVTTQIGTAPVSGNTWSTSVTLSGNGINSIVAQDTDLAGNVGTSAPVVFTLATAAPTISITSPVAGDNIINKAEAAAGVTISGIATAGGAAVNGQTATITIVDATNVVKDTYSAVVTGGAWSISVTAAQAQALADGSYSIKANVVDAAGNAAPTASQAIAVDETAPTISITSPVAGDNIINKAEAAAGVTISGIATAGGAAVNGQTATITIVDATNVVKDTYSAVVTGGAWSISVTAAQAQALADGSYSIKANVVDAAGNAAPTASQAIAVDETAPTISITSPVAGDNIINKAEAAAGVTISGIATAGGAAVNGQTATITIVDATNVVKDTYSAVVTGGAWSISVTAAQAQALADGSYSIKANVVDAAGNAAPTASQAIAVDETAPTISITSPVAGDNIINKAEAAAGVTISGIATAGGAAVNGQTATITIVDATNVVKDTYSAVVTGGAWSISVTAAQAQALADGSYSIKANVVDAAGNAAPTASQAIAVDETAPTISITSPVAGDNIINKAEAAAGVTISGIATAGGAAVNGQTATITIVDATNVVKDTYSAVVTGGAWSISVTAAQAQALADGSYSIKANVVDAAGNAAPTASQAIAVDETAPTISITSPVAGDNIINKAEAAAGVTISGIATAGGAAVNGQTATITIVDATNVVKDTYSAVVTGGAWSISVTAAQAQALADGSYSIKANVVDAAGNAAPTASQAIAVDETAPTISITSPVAGDNIINKAEAAAGVTISGIATAGGAAVNGQTATITIVDATNVVKDTYSAVVTGGAWSISVTAAQAQALADGSYSIKANVVDAAGNAAPTASQAIAVDTAPPTVSIITAGTTTNQATQPISGTVTTTEAAAGSTVALFDTVNGVTTQIGTAPVSGNTWSTSVTLSGNGINSIVAQDTDLAGNVGTSAPVVFTLATAAPTISITSPVAGDNIINKAEAAAGVTISGIATAGGAAVNGQTATITIVDATNVVKDTYSAVVTGGAWSISVTAAQAQALADGSYSIKANVVDAAGNAAPTASQAIAVDETAPTISITSPVAGDNIINKAEAAAGVTISGIATAGGAAVNGQTATITIVDATNVVKDTYSAVVTGGAWSISVTAAQAQALADGSYSIKANVVDAAGNAAPTASQAIAVDETAPTISITSPVAGDNIINKAEAAAGVTISGIATAGGAAVNGQTATITIVDATNVVKDTYSAVVTGGAWSISVTAAQAQALADGSYSIKANVVDAAGNAAPTASQAIAVDETAPTISITSPVAGDNIINKAEAAAGVTISGIATAGGAAVNGQTATITIVDATNVVKDTYSAVVTGGAWSISVTAAQAQALADGSYSIKANVVDAAGNAAPTASQAIAVDETAPTISITSPVAGDNIINKAEAAAGVTISGIATAGGAAVNGQTATITIVDATNVVKDTYSAVVTGGAWSISVTAAQAQALADGSYSIKANVVDAAGNAAPTASQAIAVDETAPTISITSPVAGDNIINKAEAAAGVTISGIATAGGAAVNGQTATITIVDATNVVKDTYSAVVTGGAWSISVTAAQAQALADGSYSIKANVVDAAGNAAPTASQAIAVDETAPTISITSPVAGDNIINKAEAAAGVTISGIATAGGAAVNGQTATITIVDATNVVKDTYSAVVTGGAWSISVTAAQAQALADGSYSIKANVVDAAGNAAPTASQAIAVDETAPTISITSPVAGDNIINKAEAAAGVTISGIATAGGAAVNGQTATITIVDATNVVKDTYSAVVTGGAWSISVTAAQAQALADGSYSIKANVVDAAGNAAPTASQAIAVDTVDAILAENLDPANGNDVTVSQSGTISGQHDGIRALTNGNGNVSVIIVANATITANQLYGIEATSSGTGSIIVTTAANDVITSGSAGINAYNQATLIPQGATSLILVTTFGTINSGTALTGGSNRPAGILAGYKGGTTNTPNASVSGNVVVNNSANIDAAGGDGIRAYTFGSGDVAVQDLASAALVAPDEFGISASTNGTGSVTVTTVAGNTITSGSTGIQAINFAAAVAVGAASSVNVTAHGTINSGTHLTPGGNQPQGIGAGYFPGNVGASDTNVTGTVNVDSFANINATAGWGIDAFNYGNGSVTLTDETGTTVSGAQYGIAAYSLSSGSFSSGSVTINVGANATISSGALYGLAGIQANESNAGNISVITATADTINSGGTGIAANNQATATTSASQISITSVGTINSGYDANQGGGAAGGIVAGYNPGNQGTVSTNVAGNVIVDSSAIIEGPTITNGIPAPASIGVVLYNFGVGNISLTLESSSQIISLIAGVNASAQGGGNVTIINNGSITDNSGVGIAANTGTGIANGVIGLVSVTNTGTVTAFGSASAPVIQINNGSTQAAKLINSGTISANLEGKAIGNQAVAVYNGTVAITNTNTGTISGNVSLNGGTFSNNAGGIWNTNGNDFFGNGISAIVNAGIINIAGNTFLGSAGTLTLTNSNIVNGVNVAANGDAFISAAVSGTGTFTIGDRAELEFANSVAGQTISFAGTNGLLVLDNPTTFSGGLFTGLTAGDAIELQGIGISSTTVSGSTLTIQAFQGINNIILNYQFDTPVPTFDILGNEVVFVPLSPISVTGPVGAQSFTTSTAQFYQLKNATVTASSANGLNIASTDGVAGHVLTVEINQSSVSTAGAFNAINLTSTVDNIELINAGTVSSPGGAGIFVNSGTGSADIIDSANVSAAQAAIGIRTSGPGTLNVAVSGGATIGSANNSGIVAIAISSGNIDVSTTQGAAVNSATSGIFAENQGTSVSSAAAPSNILVSTSGTINSGSAPGAGEPAGILAGFLGGTSAPTNPPNATVFGNVTVNNNANITANTGIGINAFNDGVGDVTVSDASSTTITATAAGATATGLTQYGIDAFNFGSGKTTVATDFGSTINSGGVGIFALNQYNPGTPSAAGMVAVIANGTINSGVNSNNGGGGAPAGIEAGFNPSGAGVFNPNLVGAVLVEDSGSITAGAGDGINAFDFGIGNVEVDLGFNATITALNSASSGSAAPFGVNAFNRGTGDVIVNMSNGDNVHSGSTGINANNQDTSIPVAANSMIAVTAAGTITSGAILANNNSQASGISAGYLGANTGGNTNINGTVIIDNSANITASAGSAINAFNFGNGNVTVNDGAGTTIAGAQYGVSAFAESGGTGSLAVNVGANATIEATNPATPSTTTSAYGILAFSTDAGDISVITSSGDTISASSAGINAVNEATVIDPSVNSSIVVTANGSIHSGTGQTGTGSAPAGILAGYLGGTTIQTNFPLTGLFGEVDVNNFATIDAAAGDGIRAYNFGIGDIEVNDFAGSITLHGQILTGNTSLQNGFQTGINATNGGSGNIDVMTAAGTSIDSSLAGSGIVAINKAPGGPAGNPFVVPATSHVSVIAHGTILSGTDLTGSGDVAAGILAGYNPNNLDTTDNDPVTGISNIHGTVFIDDFASITAAAVTDGIRGINYGDGTITIITEAGAIVSAGHYGIAAIGGDGGNISITNSAALTGGTAAIDTTTATSTETVTIGNLGHMSGNVLTENAAFDNGSGGIWDLAGASTFATGTNALTNEGIIDTNGISSVTTGATLSITNSGTVNVQSGSLDLAASVTGTGQFTIASGAQLELGGPVSAGQIITFEGSTGTLKLDDPTHFAGQILGLTGSDGIDLANFDSTQTVVTPVLGTTQTVLTVADESHTIANGTAAVITLLGNYTGSAFNFSNDTHGGVLIVDPPASAPAVITIVATGADQTLTGTGSADNFVFDFAAVGQATVTNFHPDTDVLQLKASMFANPQALLDAILEDANGNSVITLDAHDTITLTGITKAQLNQTDLHLA